MTYVQYKPKEGENFCLTQPLTLPEKFEDESAGYYKLYKIEEDHSTYYLLIGHGARCANYHFLKARIYGYFREQLSHGSGFDREIDLFARGARSSKLKLDYDPETRVISYWQYSRDEAGFLTDGPTERKLHWDGLRFRSPE